MELIKKQKTSPLRPFQPETLAEKYEIKPEEKPHRVNFDTDIQANCCPYCGYVLDDKSQELIRCHYCNHLLAWY